MKIRLSSNTTTPQGMRKMRDAFLARVQEDVDAGLWPPNGADGDEDDWETDEYSDGEECGEGDSVDEVTGEDGAREKDGSEDRHIAAGA